MRTVAEVAVETGIDPVSIANLGADWIATLIDVINARNKD